MKNAVATTHLTNSITRLIISITHVMLFSTLCLNIACVSLWRYHPRLFRQPPHGTIYRNRIESVCSSHLSSPYTYTYTNSAYEKAAIFAPSAHPPHDEALKSQGYIEIISGMDVYQARQFEAWFASMYPYGIDVQLISNPDGWALLLRFVDAESMSIIYARLIKEITRVVPFNETVIRHTIFKESRGCEHAVSPAGAVGLTQIMPFVVTDLIRARKKAGTQHNITKQLHSLNNQIQNLITVAQGEHSPVILDHLYSVIMQKRYYRDRLNILSQLPDFVIAPPPFTEVLVTLPPSLQKKLYNTAIPRLEYFIMRHGPLNVCFGMAHLALLHTTLEYYKAIGKLDRSTEPLLASQLAYNCGLRRTIKRIQSLGGWGSIFDIPFSVNGSCPPYLPDETANYGYEFIRTYLHVREGPYKTHSQLQEHYKICLTALMRSKDFRNTVRALVRHKLYEQKNQLIAALAHAIRQAQLGRIEDRTLMNVKRTFKSLPEWPLVQHMYDYLLLVQGESLRQAHTMRI